MKILVFIKEVPDVKIPVVWDDVTGKLRKDRQVWHLNPADRSALEVAIAIRREVPQTHVTAIHLGPPPGEKYIRECLALGCDRGLRVWDERLEEIRPHVKALIFSRVAETLGFDLLFTGVASQDSENGQAGLLLASCLNIPCIPAVVRLEIVEADKILVATRKLDSGCKARVSCALPAAVTMEALPECCQEPSLASCLCAWEREIPSLHVSELGIADHVIGRMNSRLIAGPLRFPKPRLKYISAPDPAQPAFARIAQLVRGAVKSRTGRLIGGTEAQVVEDLFQTLLNEGWLDHLKRNES